MTIKRIFIGDVHGLTLWEKIIDQNPDWEEVIFLGDYFDTYDKKCTSKKQFNNLKKILKFKDKYPDKVHVLLGNHDYQYIRYVTFSNMYSGYSYETDAMVRDFLRENLEKFELIYIADNILCSHAGVSTEWLEYFYGNTDIYSLQGLLDENLIEKLSSLGLKNMDFLELNYISGYSNTGDSVTNSPIWIRPVSLSKTMYTDDKINCHIVGHTQTIKEKPVHVQLEGKEIWLNDCLEYGWYLVQTEEGIKEVKICD